MLYSRIWLDISFITACLHLLATSVPQTFCVCVWNWIRCVCGERKGGRVVIFKFTLLLSVCTSDLFLTITEIMYMYYLQSLVREWSAGHEKMRRKPYFTVSTIIPYVTKRKCAVKMPGELRFLVCPGPLHRAPSHVTHTSLHVLVILTQQSYYNNSVMHTETFTFV